MKILLTAINAKYIHSNLAVYSLRAYAKEYKEHIEIAEYTINHRMEYILQEIYKKRPDVLCFSCYIWNYEYVREIAAEFHKLCPNVPIWLGGPEVSYELERTFEENPYAYGVMIGEGEKTFQKVAAHYVRGEEEQALCHIQGIAYRIQGMVQKTPPTEPVDMDTIPFCYEDMTDFTHRIIYYESSRGCPFRCSYCLSSIDKTLRFRSLSLVKKELLFFIEHHVPQVKFVDRTFNCRKEHAMAIWQFIKEHDLGITNFHFEVAADLLDDEELELLGTLRPGLVQLEIGVQSTHEPTIQEIMRVMNLEKVRNVVKRVQSGRNIHEHLDLIAGLPKEDYDTFHQSFNDIYAWKPNQLQLGFLKVLKGSLMYTRRQEYGLVYRNRAPYEVMRTNWLSFDEILKIKLVEEMLEVYYNSGQFEVTMKILDVVYPDAFLFFLELGRFYEQRGYLSMNHSRIRRLEILMEFIRQDAVGNTLEEELLKEALLFDLYYRENAKSRPDWAIPVSSFSKVTRRVCKNGKNSHVEPFHYHFPTGDTKSIPNLPERLEDEVYVLFEYDKRDPLSHQAKVTTLRKEDYEDKL